MALLKEDGSLDIERINKLPIEDYMEEIASLNKKQYNEYISTLPLNESHEQVKSVKLDCTIEEDMKVGPFDTYGDFYDYYLKLLKEYRERNFPEVLKPDWFTE